MTDTAARERTPGPWKANLYHTQKSAGRTYGFIYANGIVPIAAVTLGVEGMSEDEGRANAAFIVAAENSHDDLVAALIASEREYESLEDQAPTDSGCIECTAGTVPDRLNTGLCAHHLRRAALSKAGVK